MYHRYHILGYHMNYNGCLVYKTIDLPIIVIKLAVVDLLMHNYVIAIVVAITIAIILDLHYDIPIKSQLILI